MNEEEGNLCHGLANDYWTKFGQLVAKTLKRCPEHLREELKMQLQDRSSVYGSGYEKYMTPNQKVILAIGAPGSGKSTWSKQFALDNKFTRISTDELRAVFGKGENDQSVSEKAFAATRTGLEVALAKGESVIIDATNMYPKTRRQFLDIARKAGAETEAAIFEVDRETLIARNIQRGAEGGRNVPVEVIDTMLGRYVRPTLGEFDIVTFYSKVDAYEQQPVAQ